MALSISKRPYQPNLPPYEDLLTGHYRQPHPYKTFRPNGSEDWLMILTLDGQGYFGHVEGGETIAGAGDIVLLRPKTFHSYGVAATADHWDLLWTHFRPRELWQEWMRWPEEAPGLMRLTLSEPIVRRKITARFLEVHRLAVGAMPRKIPFAMNALEEVLLWCSTQVPRSGTPAVDPRVQAVRIYVQEHLGEKLTLDMLADTAGLSASRLTQLFRRETGTTPAQYIELRRLERAQRLLVRTTMTVGMIAQEVGFENPFYFTLRFKRHLGVAPTDYRRQFEAGEEPTS